MKDETEYRYRDLFLNIFLFMTNFGFNVNNSTSSTHLKRSQVITKTILSYIRRVQKRERPAGRSAGGGTGPVAKHLPNKYLWHEPNSSPMSHTRSH